MFGRILFFSGSSRISRIVTAAHFDCTDGTTPPAKTESSFECAPLIVCSPCMHTYFFNAMVATAVSAIAATATTITTTTTTTTNTRASSIHRPSVVVVVVVVVVVCVCVVVGGGGALAPQQRTNERMMTQRQRSCQRTVTSSLRLYYQYNAKYSKCKIKWDRNTLPFLHSQIGGGMESTTQQRRKLRKFFLEWEE